MGRRFSFLRNYNRKWRMGMAFVMALVLLFANAGVTSLATEPDDGSAQEVPDEDMEMEITGDDDGSDGEMETLSDEDEPGEDREITGGDDGSDGETEASSDEDEPDENAALYDEDDADENSSDVDDGVDDAEAVVEESENAYPAEGQDDEENAGAVDGEASDTDDGSAAPEEEPAADGETEVTDANTAAEEQPAAEDGIEATDADTAAEEQPVGNDNEKTDIEEPEVEETETEGPVDSPAFAEEEIIDGVKVTVAADGGVFPEGATLSVRKISGSEEKSVSAAVEDAKGNGGNEEKTAVSYTFDIKVLDKDGNEIEPDEKKGSVSVSFALDEAENQNLAAEVWHITGETGGLNAEALDAKTDGETVTAETDGFSYYQVEFTYDGKQYVLPGDESVALTEILADVGITNADGSAAKDADITAAKGSDDSLFTVEKTNGVWKVTAVTAFHTEEWLRVTVDGVEYEIVVTDAVDGANVFNYQSYNRYYTLDSKTYVLTDDVKLESYIRVDSGVTATIDLAGHTIDRGLHKTYTNGMSDYSHISGGQVIGIFGGTLILKDSVGGGKITGGASSFPTTGGAGGIYVWGGTFRMEGGTITGNDGEHNNGSSTGVAGVYGGLTGFTMSGGIIESESNLHEAVSGKIIPDGVTVVVAYPYNIGSSSNMESTSEFGPISGNVSVTTKRTVTLNANYSGGSNSSTTIIYGSAVGTLPTPTRSGYTFDGWYTASSGGTKVTNSSTAWGSAWTGIYYAHWTPNPATVTTAPTAKSLTYTGSAQALVNAGAASNGTMYYKLSGGSYSTTIPEKTNAGTYTVWYQAKGDGGDSVEKSVSVTISKKDATVTAKNQTISLNGSIQTGTTQATLSGAVSGHTLGAVTLTGSSSSAATTSGTITPGSAAIKSGNADVTSNYNISYVSGTLTVTKANISPTVTLAGWTYGDTANTPSVTGNSGNGTVTYAYKKQGENDSNYTSTKPSDAGAYTVRATIAETANYNGGTATGDFVIAKRIVTVASGIKAESRLYNGGTNATLDTSGAVFSDKMSGDTLTVSATGSFANKNAGQNRTVNITDLTLGGTSAGNYQLASERNQAATSAMIKAREITLRSASASKEYDGSPLTNTTVTVDDEGFVSGEGASYTVTGSQTEVGSSTNTFSYTLNNGTLADNYTITCIPGTLTVTKANNTWMEEPSIAGWVYGDTPAAPNKGTTKFGDTEDITVKYQGRGGTDYAQSETPPTAAGTYSAIFEQAGTANYESISQEKEFTISPKEVGLAWSDLTFTYDGESHKPSATATGLVEDDTCTVTVTGGQTDAGSYTATASSLSNNNYKLPSANTVSFTIGRASISPTVSLDNWIYGETAADPVVSGNPESGAVTYEYKASTADDSDYTGAKPTAAGTYTVKATIAQTHNYNGGTATANFTIEKAEPAVTAPTAKTLTYTGSEQGLVAPGAAVGGTMEYSLSKEGDYGTAVPTGADAGSYTVWYRVVGDSNHNDAEAQSVSVTIEPKELAITARAQTITYGGTIASGTGQVDAAGLVSGHTLKSITLTPSTTDATTSGTITPDAAKIESDDRDVTANYSIAYQTGALIIEKAEPAVTAPTAKTLTYTGSPQELVDSGEADGGTMKYSLSKEGDYGTAVPTGTDARSYTVWYRVVGDKNHNDAEAQSVSITIAPKELVITAKAQTITYGGAIAAGTEQVDAVGLVSGHTLKSITLTPSTTEATTSGTITPDAAKIESDDTDVTVNYSITYLTGALIIEKAEPAVTAPTAKTLTYTGSPQELVDSGEADGGTMEYSLSKEGDYGTAVPTGTDAGSYTVWYRVVGDSNHNDAAARSVSITIAPKELTITARAQTITYGGAIAAGTRQVDATGLVSGHILTSITLTPSTTNATTSGTIMPGAAKIKSNDTDVTANYGITYRRGALIIEKAESAVTAPTAKTLTYTGSPQELVGAGSAMGGTLQYKLDSGSYSEAIPAATDAGGYTIQYRVVGDKNHNDTSPASLHVTIAKAGLSLSVNLEGWTYGTKANAPSITGNSGSGAVAYAYKAKDATEAEYSPAVPTEAGEYMIKATVAETANYNGGTATASFTIDKAASIVTAPTAMTLTHNGSAQQLVIPGTAKGGTLYYAMTITDTSPAASIYTTSIPTAADAGT